MASEKDTKSSTNLAVLTPCANRSAVREADARLRAWLEKYTPIEREIMEAHAKRCENAARRRSSKARQFGDLCEATEGLAAYWRQTGVPFEQQLRLVKGDALAVTCLVAYYGKAAAREVDRLRHAIKRPLYYEAENRRRSQLAAERRKIVRRTTENPCPTREQILEAWTHRRDSHGAAIRFGSLIEDLECYLDNSLRLGENGAIVGRNGGVKRWLQEEIPALFVRYTTVMRFKAAAHKARQIAGLADPTPASRLVEDTEAGSKVADAAPALGVVRAQAIWREVVAGVAESPTALFARMDALLDPERVEEANMLAGWRRRYENEITLRTKSRWWRRLFPARGRRGAPSLSSCFQRSR